MPEVQSVAIPFARVLAIAIQGLWDAMPRRSKNSIDVTDWITLKMWTGTRGMHKRVILTSEYHDGEGIYTRMPPFHDRKAMLQGKPFIFEWLVHDPRVSKGSFGAETHEVEKLISTFFTRPYPVQKVSREATALAERLCEEEAARV